MLSPTSLWPTLIFRYLAYVLVGGACFMAIERPLEKKTCDEIEKQMQSGYAAFKSSTGKSLSCMTQEYKFLHTYYESLKFIGL